MSGIRLQRRPSTRRGLRIDRPVRRCWVSSRLRPPRAWTYSDWYRLGRHPHLRFIGEVDPESASDLCRAVVSFQPLLHLPTQPQVPGQLHRLWSATSPPSVGISLSDRGLVSPHPDCPLEFTADRGRVPAQLPPDGPHPPPLRPEPHDLLTLVQTQVAADRLNGRNRVHPASLTEHTPTPPARRASRPGRRLGVQPRPDRLPKQPVPLLRNRRLGAPSHRNSSNQRCCITPWNPPVPGRQDLPGQRSLAPGAAGSAVPGRQDLPGQRSR